MAKGKNYRQAILATVGELNLWDKEVHLDALANDTGIEAVKVSACISQMRHDGYPIDIVRREGRRNVSWKFKDQANWTKKVVADSKAKGEAFKGTNYITQAQAHDETVSRTAAFKKGYTTEDLEYGRRVLVNYDRLPQEVRDKIEAFKEVAPEFTEDLEKLLVKVLGVTPEQDADPSFWAVDQFADGALMLARKDGTHWKATKL